MSILGRLSFLSVLALLGVLTLAGVVGLRLAGAGVYSLAFVLVPIALAGVYLYENRDHPPIDLSPAPVPATASSPASPERPPPVVDLPPEEPMPSGDEPFDDPVELADRIDRGEATPDDPAPSPATSADRPRGAPTPPTE